MVSKTYGCMLFAAQQGDMIQHRRMTIGFIQKALNVKTKFHCFVFVLLFSFSIKKIHR